MTDPSSTRNDGHEDPDSRRPKKLIFAPGDVEATPDLKVTTSETSDPSEPPHTTAPKGKKEQKPSRSDTSTPTSDSQVISHAARAHQFTSNPPLTISQIHPSNPLHQFHGWFRDPRLPASSAPETCTLATASLPSGRVSARAVYLKELDERGWVIYSNWGSREGKGAQVFGQVDNDGELGSMPRPGTCGAGDENLQEELVQGNKWAALTFNWSMIERQVRVEGLLEPLSYDESEMYWRTRERDSQIGAWASWQSKVLWEAGPDELVENRRKSLASSTTNAAGNATCGETPGDIEETDIEDGRAMLEQRVQEMKARFVGVDKIPLPPFWGGVRLVPESVEFWQGRRSRLHDRFRYVRVHDKQDEESMYRWRIQRLSP